MRLVALQSLMNAEVVDVLGYLLPPGARCFQRLGGFSSTPAPNHKFVKIGFILS
jgi:hypothetical protein